MSGKTYQASGITVVRDTGSTERLLVDGQLVPRCACTFVIEPTKLAKKAVPHPFALGCLPGSACGLYLMDKSTSQGDCGGAVWRARDEVHPEAAANGREVFRALYNQPCHTSRVRRWKKFTIHYNASNHCGKSWNEQSRIPASTLHL
jgi:hypothetical protein